MRVLTYLFAAVLIMSGAMLVHASAETDRSDEKPKAEQQKELPEGAKPSRKLYASADGRIALA